MTYDVIVLGAGGVGAEGAFAGRAFTGRGRCWAVRHDRVHSSARPEGKRTVCALGFAREDCAHFASGTRVNSTAPTMMRGVPSRSAV